MSNNFTPIPDQLFKFSNLSNQEFRIVAVLYSFFYNNGYSIISDQTLGDQIGKASRSIQRTISDLRDKGYIYTESKATQNGKSRKIFPTGLILELLKNQKGSFYHEKYDIIIPQHQNSKNLKQKEKKSKQTTKMAIAKNEDSQAPKMAIRNRQKFPYNNTSKDNNTIPSPYGREQESEIKDKNSFEIWFNKYGIDRSKKDSERYWNKYLSESDRVLILKELQNLKIKYPDKQYQPDPINYLRGQKWKDKARGESEEVQIDPIEINNKCQHPECDRIYVINSNGIQRCSKHSEQEIREILINPIMNLS